jgi:hypothetical protein
MNLKTQISFLALGLSLTPLGTTHAQITFTKVTGGDIVNDIGPFVGVTWGDFNNDGFLDLSASFYGGTNVLYRNNRGSSFTKVAQGDPDADTDLFTGSTAADYDNDGNLDLIVSAGQGADSGRPNWLYHNTGNGAFSRVSGGSLTNQLGYFRVNACADFDNDGFVDLLVSDTGDSGDHGGQNFLFRNNGDGTFTQFAGGAIANDRGVAYGVHWADYDSDGLMDLLVVNNPFLSNRSSVNFLYHNEGHGIFSRVLTNAIATDNWPAHANTGAWGDYDNDGFPDLFITANHTGNRLYHNNGNGRFTRVTSGPMLSPPPNGGYSVGAAWGDYDNDGYLDLFVTNGDGTNGLFHNNGDGTFSQVVDAAPLTDSGPGIESNTCGWVDYDNDGFLDLLFDSNPTDDGSQRQHNLYHNGGNTNGWLHVRCVGTVSNRSAIGAKVRVMITVAGKPLWQLREITTGCALEVIPLVAYFGLGQATNVDVLRIEWPSGTVQELRNVSPKQILTVTEPPRLLASVLNGALQFSQRGGRGFQYDIEQSPDLKAWASLGSVTITNMSGTAPIMGTNAPGSGRTFYRAVAR